MDSAHVSVSYSSCLEEGADVQSYLSVFREAVDRAYFSGYLSVLHRGPQFQADVSQQQRFHSPHCHSVVDEQSSNPSEKKKYLIRLYV